MSPVKFFVGIAVARRESREMARLKTHLAWKRTTPGEPSDPEKTPRLFAKYRRDGPHKS
jgi:hypothetical protein